MADRNRRSYWCWYANLSIHYFSSTHSYKGKSSLLQALFRMVEIQSGKIEIDGVNISVIGLEALRSQLALVPQDSVLFLGTLRENL